MGTGGKAWPGRDTDRSPPSSAEVKNEQELYLLSPHVPPWCVVGQLYFFFTFIGIVKEDYLCPDPLIDWMNHSVTELNPIFKGIYKLKTKIQKQWLGLQRQKALETMLLKV
jgi:hypothetical protein